jgi:hypothetical protein
MKEVIGHGSNVFFLPTKKEGSRSRVLAQVELVLVLCEPTYDYSLDGLTSTRKVSDIRCVVQADKLAKFASELRGIAMEALKLEAEMNPLDKPEAA